MSTPTLRTLRHLFDNPLILPIFKLLVKKSRKSKKTYLEKALEDMTGNIKKIPIYEKYILIPFLEVLTKKLINTFGGTNEDFKQTIEDLKKPYIRRAINAVVKGVVDFGVRVPFVPGSPFLVVWDYTWRCNLRCKHCYIDAGFVNRQEMTLNERRRALDTLADAGLPMIAFSGGEPLMGVGIFEIIKRAHDYGMYTAMATNGTLLTKEVTRKLVKMGLNYVQISLDAPIPKVHDDFRGIPGVWNKTVQGIKNAKEAGLYVEISTVVTYYNYHLIDKMIQLAKKLNVDLLMHYNFIPTGRGRDIIKMDLAPEDREKLLRRLAEALYNGELQVASTAPQFARATIQFGLGLEQKIVGGHFFISGFTNKAIDIGELVGGCGAGRTYISMEPNGDIYPCVFLPIRVGNILKDDFTDLWRNNQILNTLRDRTNLKGPCATCPYRYICGGCRARAYAYFRDITAPDPGCIYNRKYWEALKKELTKKPIQVFANI
ncbi:MAG: radical SAM protein [Candidatus Njordarchaeales archaeon]